MVTKDGGITATAPDGWKPERVNLKGLFTELSKAVAKVGGGAAMVAGGAAAGVPTAVLGGWNTIASALPDSVAALANVSTLTEGERAYVLVRRALSNAIAELVAEGRGSLDPAKINYMVGEGLFEQAEAQKRDDETWVLAPDFLERPREVELLAHAQPVLKDWLAAHGMTTTQAATTAQRLPHYFGLSLHEELTLNSDVYESLKTFLKSDTATLNREAWAWQRYRAELIREPHRPLFDEKFGLASVFVPLRAVWKEKIPVGNREMESGYSIDLETGLRRWLESNESWDGLRVLSGDPGSGKSSCAKIWAAWMAETHPGWRVVFVPLHRFDYKGDLRESLKSFLRDNARIVADLLEPLCPDPVLLFFDGLDELAMQGKSARQAAVAFVRQVNDVLRDQNRDRRRVLVVLGGRQIVVQDCGEELRSSRQILHLQGYSPGERTLWWEQYGRIIGEGYGGLPAQLERDDLDPLTAQPLLNYLLALALHFKRGELDFEKGVTVNALYAVVLESIYNRVWGEGGSWSSPFE